MANSVLDEPVETRMLVDYLTPWGSSGSRACGSGGDSKELWKICGKVQRSTFLLNSQKDGVVGDTGRFAPSPAVSRMGCRVVL
jgi:hypothetical protein